MLRSTWPTTRSPDRTTGWSLLDAVTLFLSARLMARFADKKVTHVVSAFSRLASVLPTPLAAHVHATVAAMQEGQVDRRYAPVFETVATAWAESRKLRIAYSRQAPDGVSKVTRRVVARRYLEPNPWGRGCYLIADDELSATGARSTRSVLPRPS